jgi:pantothenate kinase
MGQRHPRNLGCVSRLVLGIAGAPGAGKSTLAAQIVDSIDDAILLPMDGFHLPQARLRELGRRDRMGAPDTFDVDAFVATLAAVRNDGDPVWAPSFDRETEEPAPDTIEISPSFRTVVVEGNYLLHDAGGWERVAPLLDVTLFVDVDPELRRRRLIERHIRFGKSADDAAAWVMGPDEANARLIEAGANRASYRIRGS